MVWSIEYTQVQKWVPSMKPARRRYGTQAGYTLGGAGLENIQGIN